MKLHVLLIVGFILGVTGCDREEQAAPSAEEPVAEKKAYQNEAFMQHMHAHADQIDDLNAALDDNDFDAILTPAYWLSRHETVNDIPADWQPYVVQMREAARAVENTPGSSVGLSRSALRPRKSPRNARGATLPLESLIAARTRQPTDASRLTGSVWHRGIAAPILG